MATPDPAETADLISLLRNGEASLELRRFAARGLLPLDREGQMRALLAVLGDSDPIALGDAQKTFRSTPPDEITHFLRYAEPTGIELDAVARHSEDPFVLEQLIRHRNVADETLETLARSVTGTAQDALIVNQVRLLRKPALIEALFENPELTLDSRRRLNEIREEFFDKQKRRRAAERLREEEEEAALRAAEEAAVAAEAEQADAQTQAEGAVESDLQESLTTGAVYRRIAVMTVSEKIKLAYSGGKEERSILIGDANRLVGLAVLKSRGLTANEVSSYCSMRHLDEEIFRKICLNREWVRQTPIMLALVKNPKVALALTLPLVKHLPLKELKNIMRDLNLPEGLRVTARKLMIEKRH